MEHWTCSLLLLEKVTLIMYTSILALVVGTTKHWTSCGKKKKKCHVKVPQY